ncbi:MAG TPA: YncE family protein [Pseudacidobacterium sp.]|jgi:DNA-binding beta-propeller fold protein YncE|nr:YncE family protein [Pseudacidobacterium sp.]
MRLKLPILLVVYVTCFFLQDNHLIIAESSASQNPYSIQQKWPLSGAGGWGSLFVDTASHQLYVPRTDRVAVIDTSTGKELSEINGLVDARSVALVPPGRYVYVTDVTDGKAGFVRVFERATGKLVTSISTGRNPDAVVFEPGTKTVAVFSRRDQNATLVQTKSNQVASVLRLPGFPAGAIVDGTGNIFVLIEDKNQLIRIDAKSGRDMSTWELPACQAPTGLAIDAKNKLLFALCENRTLTIVRTDNGALAATIELPGGGPGTVAFDAQRKLLFVADGGGGLIVIQQEDPEHYTVRQRLDILPGSHVLAIDTSENRAYLIAAEYTTRTDDVSEELKLRPAPAAGKCSVIVVGPS